MYGSNSAASNAGIALLLIAHLASSLPAQSLDSQPTQDPARRQFESRDILEALAEAWPGRFSKTERVGSDLDIALDGRWYRWAGGRLLPADWEGDDETYSPWPFYPYPREIPPIRELGEAEKARLEAELSANDRNPPKRFPAFYDQLWYSPDENRAWGLMKTMRFLGKEVLIHPDLLEELSAIERELRSAATGDAAVAAWIDSIGSIEGFVWRSVAGTKSRSMHSYGAALDILPSRTKNLSWYWLDARWSGLPWYQLSLSRRIFVPPKVVAIFERYGFVWGGKWFYWDLVHFEYRPEILILNGQKPAYQAALR